VADFALFSYAFDMKGNIRAAIMEALARLGMSPVDFVVEHPADLAHGDYATNVAMAAAKVAGMNPRELAERIVSELRSQNIPYVAAIEVAGPGFINLALTREFFTEQIQRVLSLKDAWGKSDILAEKNVMVEYTDPNPFKEFHVGHLFTNTVGESIARLFMMMGADVHCANYQGDVGLHVAHAVWGMQRMGITPESDFTARDLGKAYALGATAYKKEDGTAKDEIRTLNKVIYERSDEAVNALYDKGRAVSLAYFESIYAMLDTHFDHYFFESVAAPRGKELVLANPDVFVESDGARVFKGEEHGLHTRVFMNAEGLPTYEAKELALAKMKEEEFLYDHSVVSTSAEINEYFKVLLKAMSFVYPELAAKTEHIGHGTVRLPGGKMSSRTGDVIAALDFIEEIKEAARVKMTESVKVKDGVDVSALETDVAIGAIKYAILKSNIRQDSVFNKDHALSFEGDSGPYLQYTNARIGSMLEKAYGEGIVPSLERAPSAAFVPERVLYQFPEVVMSAYEHRAPHLIATYLSELAGAFNTWYANEKIVDASDEYSPYKVALAGAVAQTIKNGLWVLGIKAPERM
jgi:arginyl-tRNA synthetase